MDLVLFIENKLNLYDGWLELDLLRLLYDADIERLFSIKDDSTVVDDKKIIRAHLLQKTNCSKVTILLDSQLIINTKIYKWLVNLKSSIIIESIAQYELLVLFASFRRYIVGSRIGELVADFISFRYLSTFFDLILNLSLYHIDPLRLLYIFNLKRFRECELDDCIANILNLIDDKTTEIPSFDELRQFSVALSKYKTIPLDNFYTPGINILKFPKPIVNTLLLVLFHCYAPNNNTQTYKALATTLKDKTIYPNQLNSIIQFNMSTVTIKEMEHLMEANVLTVYNVGTNDRFQAIIYKYRMSLNKVMTIDDVYVVTNAKLKFITVKNINNQNMTFSGKKCYIKDIEGLYDKITKLTDGKPSILIRDSWSPKSSSNIDFEHKRFAPIYIVDNNLLFCKFPEKTISKLEVLELLRSSGVTNVIYAKHDKRS